MIGQWIGLREQLQDTAIFHRKMPGMHPQVVGYTSFSEVSL